VEDRNLLILMDTVIFIERTSRIVSLTGIVYGLMVINKLIYCNCLLFT